MSRIGEALALPLSFRRGPRNHKGVRAISLITAHANPKDDTSESWAAQDIQDIVNHREFLAPNIARRTITITVMERLP